MGLDVEVHSASPAHRHCVAAFATPTTMSSASSGRSRIPTVRRSTSATTATSSTPWNGRLCARPQGPGLGVVYDWTASNRIRSRSLCSSNPALSPPRTNGRSSSHNCHAHRDQAWTVGSWGSGHRWLSCRDLHDLPDGCSGRTGGDPARRLHRSRAGRDQRPRMGRAVRLCDGGRFWRKCADW